MTNKIDNTKLTMLKYIHAALEPLVPDLDKIWMNKYFTASTRRPNWDTRYGKNQVKIGGIDITVIAQSVNGWETIRNLKFGVRVDKDGAIDIQKLADKINDKRAEIEEIIKLAEENERIRELRREMRYENADVLEKLVEEGLIGHAWEFTETHDGFKAEIKLENEEELRAFINFKKRLHERRGMSEEEKAEAQARADHGVFG